MDEKEFERLLTITETEPICAESYMCLKEDSIDGPYGRWGWNNNLNDIRDHFLYVFILGNITQYNKNKNINKISDDLILSILNEKDKINNKSKEEEKFLKKWHLIKNINNFFQLKLETKKMCSYLSSLGYVMNFILYKNPKKALSKAIELDQYLPDGEAGFGEFLRENLEEKN